MRILVTSGGTREQIDDVRYIGNASTGRTGALIAEEAVRRYHTTYLLSGTGAARPAEWVRKTGLLVERTFGNAADLEAQALDLLGTFAFDAVIAAAAVADYTVDRTEGKIPSGTEDLLLRLKPTHKIVDRLREVAPAARMVVFKLEAGVSDDELVRKAAATLTRVGAVLAVANHAEGMGGAAHDAMLVDPAGNVEPVKGRERLALRIIERLQGGAT